MTEKQKDRDVDRYVCLDKIPHFRKLTTFILYSVLHGFALRYAAAIGLKQALKALASSCATGLCPADGDTL